MKLTKTNYLRYRDCAHNAWVAVHRPDVYDAHPPSEFEQALMETGREVDELARVLFPGGRLIERGDIATTAAYVAQRASVLYQPVFETDRFATACDILQWNEVGVYDLYEVKSSTSDAKRDRDELYTYDLAFQGEVLRQREVPVGRCFIVRLRSSYERGDELDIRELFSIEDFTQRAAAVREAAKGEMEAAYTFVSSQRQPDGPCNCMYRGRSAHCTTFQHINPSVPAYSVHDIARIGTSRAKLEELVERNILAITDVPDDFLSRRSSAIRSGLRKAAELRSTRWQSAHFSHGSRSPSRSWIMRRIRARSPASKGTDRLIRFRSSSRLIS
jgi:hypothetical protein